MTSVARTILDCAGILDARAVERLCAEAELACAFDRAALQDLIARHPGHHGLGRLVGVLGELRHGESLTESALEETLLAAFRAARLPDPECQAKIPLPDGRHVRADFLWRSARLVVEADGRHYHDHLRAYRDDRARDLALLRLGYTTVRFSDADVRDPARCAAAVADLLLQRAALAAA